MRKNIHCFYQVSSSGPQVAAQKAPLETISNSCAEAIADNISHSQSQLVGDSSDLSLSGGLNLDLDSNPLEYGGLDLTDAGLGVISPSFLSWDHTIDAVCLPQIHHFKDRIVLGTYYTLSLTSSLISIDTRTILERRGSKAGPHGSAVSRAYCMSTLRSYPGMLCSNDGTLPPFIHAKSRTSPWKAAIHHSTNQEATLPEPLAICSGIMQMYMTRSSGNIAFIWRTIQAESWRIENEVSRLWCFHDSSLIDAVPLLRCLGHTCLNPSHDYVHHPRSTG